MSTCKALSAAVALSAALALTAVPASATTPPTTLASALAALTAAQAQVRAAISDEATTSVATWDAQMKAALAAEALAEAQLRPFLVPPATTDFGVTHSFVYKTGVPYTVQLNPINGSSNGGASQGPCLAGSASEPEPFRERSLLLHRRTTSLPAQRRSNQSGHKEPSASEGRSVWIYPGTELTVLASNGDVYKTDFARSGSDYPVPGGSSGDLDGPEWFVQTWGFFNIPTGTTVVQIKWSNLDSNGETTTAVWNV